MFQESCLEDVSIESGLYRSSSTMVLLQGKSYNRGMIMEKLLRLKWDALDPGLVKEEVEDSKAKEFQL